MLDIIITIVLTSAFFILFFKPNTVTKNKRKEDQESTAHGFIEDTEGDPFLNKFVPPKNASSESMFTGYSSISQYNWLHGFPHEKA